MGFFAHVSCYMRFLVCPCPFFAWTHKKFPSGLRRSRVFSTPILPKDQCETLYSMSLSRCLPSGSPPFFEYPRSFPFTWRPPGCFLHLAPIWVSVYPVEPVLLFAFCVPPPFVFFAVEVVMPKATSFLSFLNCPYWFRLIFLAPEAPTASIAFSFRGLLYLLIYSSEFS